MIINILISIVLSIHKVNLFKSKWVNDYLRYKYRFVFIKCVTYN